MEGIGVDNGVTSPGSSHSRKTSLDLGKMFPGMGPSGSQVILDDTSNWNDEELRSWVSQMESNVSHLNVDLKRDASLSRARTKMAGFNLPNKGDKFNIMDWDKNAKSPPGNGLNGSKSPLNSTSLSRSRYEEMVSKPHFSDLEISVDDIIDVKQIDLEELDLDISQPEIKQTNGSLFEISPPSSPIPENFFSPRNLLGSYNKKISTRLDMDFNLDSSPLFRNSLIISPNFSPSPVKPLELDSLPEIPELPDIPHVSKSAEHTPVTTPEPYQRPISASLDRPARSAIVPPRKSSPNIRTEHQSSFSPNIKTEPASYRPPSRSGSMIPSPKKTTSPAPHAVAPIPYEGDDDVPSTKKQGQPAANPKSALPAPKASVLDRPKSALAGSVKTPAKGSAIPAPKASRPQELEEPQEPPPPVRPPSQSSMMKTPASYKPAAKTSKIAAPSGIPPPKTTATATATKSAIARPKSALANSGY